MLNYSLAKTIPINYNIRPMPMQSITVTDRAYQGEVMSAGRPRRVWLFRVPGHPAYFVLSIEGSACLAFIPGECEITGLDLVTAGCDLLLAGQVVALLQETLPSANSTSPSSRRIENSPLEGNQTTQHNKHHGNTP